MRATRTFSIDDQIVFAGLSGDRNPMHIDEIAARRLLFGKAVVHGIHALLWALDTWLAGRESPLVLTSLSAEFSRPVTVGDSVELSVVNDDGATVTLQIEREEAVLFQIKVGYASAGEPSPIDVPDRDPEASEPRDLQIQDIKEASGALDLTFRRDAFRERFPKAARLLPPEQIAVLLASTRLVGMECPGLHSIYQSLKLELGPSETGGEARLRWRVKRVNEKSGAMTLELESPSAKGSIRAFLRPRPVKQPSFAELRSRVSADEFEGERALVVGGSRGLGEIAAKLLAAGGAEVRLTYHCGAEDAQRVVDDALQPDSGDGEGPFGDWWPNRLYYFATPWIAQSRKGQFSPDIFRRFCEYYVDGFLSLVDRLGPELQSVYYPSSVFVDSVPANMAEYAASKAAGEVLCKFLESTRQGLTTFAARLPRTQTDQTVGLLPSRSDDPVEIILDSIRRFHALE